MLYAYPPISIAMDITIAPTKVTKLIAQQSLVPTINFFVQMEEQIARPNALPNHSFVMENVIVKMELMKKLLVQLPLVPH
jgi:hypothetical protein